MTQPREEKTHAFPLCTVQDYDQYCLIGRWMTCRSTTSVLSLFQVSSFQAACMTVQSSMHDSTVLVGAQSQAGGRTGTWPRKAPLPAQGGLRDQAG